MMAVGGRRSAVGGRRSAVGGRTADEWEAEIDARRRRLEQARVPWLRELLAQLLEGALMARRRLSRDEVLAGASPAVRAANPLFFPAEASPAPRAPATTTEPAGPAMNATETRYAQRLRALGLEPLYEAITLCLTSGRRRRRYTPDFLVVVDGEIELVEVKGAYVYEDAKLKFDFAVEQWGHLFTFTWAVWARGEWTTRRFPRRPTAGAAG